MRYFSVPLISLQASIFLISHSFLLLTWISSRGRFTYLGKGFIVAFRSLSGEKMEWTLTESGSLTLYKFPTLLRILYGSAIW